MPRVVIPFRGGCPHRERALEYVLGRYQWPVTVAPGPDPWIKAAAVMPAVAATDAEVVVVADADVFCDGIGAAVEAVEDGAPWAIPHESVYRLSEPATANVLAGADWEDQEVVQRVYRGVEGGGCLVIPRTTLLDVPLDPRFIGWGQEDTSHAAALRTLAGEPWRGTAPLVHLYHPPQERLTRRRGSPASWVLYRRYLAARNDPVAMRSLIEEVTDARNPAEPSVHDHPSLSVGHR